MNIYIFSNIEKKSGIEYHFILYLIWLVHFSTNTHAHTHSYTLFYALFHPHEKVENIQRTMIGIMWQIRSCIVVVQTELWLGIL